MNHATIAERTAAECRVLDALYDRPMSASELRAGPLRRTAFGTAARRDELLAGLVADGRIRVERGLYRLAAGKCRVCGCTDEWGCDGGCGWVEPDLCSECVGGS